MEFYPVPNKMAGEMTVQSFVESGKVQTWWRKAIEVDHKLWLMHYS